MTFILLNSSCENGQPVVEPFIFLLKSAGVIIILTAKCPLFNLLSFTNFSKISDFLKSDIFFIIQIYEYIFITSVFVTGPYKLLRIRGKIYTPANQYFLYSFYIPPYPTLLKSHV